MNNTQKKLTFWAAVAYFFRRAFDRDAAVSLRRCDEFRQEHYLDLPPRVGPAPRPPYQYY